MTDATSHLERILDAIERLAEDAEADAVHLPEIGRVRAAGLLLGSVLAETRKRDRRSGPAPRWGMDNSVPAGDRL